VSHSTSASVGGRAHSPRSHQTSDTTGPATGRQHPAATRASQRVPGAATCSRSSITSGPSLMV
jgi:hypothetical protein